MQYFDWKDTIKINIKILEIVGLWPDEGRNYGNNFYTIYSFISIILFIYGHNFFQTVNIYFIFPDLQAISGTIFVTLSEMLTIVKSYYIIQNTNMLKQLMQTLNCKIFQPRNKRQIELIKPSLNFWKKVSTLLWSMSAGAVFFWATYPILDQSAKESRLPFMAWYPFNAKVSPYYELTYIYQIASTAFIAAATLSIDTLIAALNMYIGAQCDILCDELQRFCDHKNAIKSNKKLLLCVQHHKEILK